MNTIKTFFLMMVMTALLLLVGVILGGMFGLIFALVFAVVMNFGAYWFSDRIALGMTHARAITENDDPELYSIVREQASLAGLPMPNVFEIESDSPNAFATGRNPAHATVAVTTGIRRILTRQELGGVLAHEMAHVGNRDTLIMAMVATIAGAISMLAMIAQFSAIFGGMGGGRGRDNFIGLMVVAIVMPIAAALVRSAISRTREFQADATGAHVVKAFNAIGMVNVGHLDFGGTRAAGFFCGDDADAKAMAAGLVEEVGFEPIDCGPLRAARLLEPMAAMWVRLAYVEGGGPNFAFGVLRHES